MDIVSKLLGFSLLICVMNQGVMAIVLVAVVTGTFNVILKVYISKRILEYKYREHMEDNVPILTISAIMGVPVYLINLFEFSDIITLGIQIPLGIIIYLLLSYLFKMEGLTYALDFIKKTKESNCSARNRT